MTISEREYWTTTEAAAVMGRSATYWARMFDIGCLLGYKSGQRRHLNAESCRAHLARLSEPVPDGNRAGLLEATKTEIRQYWNRERNGVAG